MIVLKNYTVRYNSEIRICYGIQKSPLNYMGNTAITLPLIRAHDRSF